jgi:hypothetical protein
MTKIIQIAALLLVASSCGDILDKKKTDDSAASKTDPTSGAAFELKGSITAAFDVTVDGEPYADLETFYTEEIGKLPSKVAKQGNDGWDVKFDAEIGFTDLYNQMSIFAQSTSDRGYQGRGFAKGDGNFVIKMPKEAEGDTFKIRGVKRTAVILKKDGETKKFCYNFGPQDSEVPYADRDKPIIMNSFTTRITAYECVQEDTTGLEIPGATPTVGTASTDNAATGASVGLTATLTIDAGSEFQGMAADATNIFVLVSGQIFKVTDGKLVKRCALVSTEGLRGLAWDGQYFYSLASINTGTFHKFNSDCTDAGTVDTGLSVQSNAASHITAGNGRLFWTRWGGSTAANTLTSIDLSNNQTSTIANATYNGKTTKFDRPDLMVKGIARSPDGDFLWSVFQEDTSDNRTMVLWSVSLTNSAESRWMALPTKDFLDLQKIRFVAAQDSANILLGTLIDATTLKLYSVNASSL